MGKGSYFEKVYLVKYINKYYAMKIKKKSNNQEYNKKILELIMNHKNSDFVVNLEYAFQTKDHYKFIFIYMK